MRRIGALLAVVLFGASSAVGRASPAPEGLIYAADIYTGGSGPVAVRPDGTGFGLSCGGDVTHSGSPRRFLRAEDGALVWSDDRCVSRPLYADPAAPASAARWSPDGQRVAFSLPSWTEPDAGGEPVRWYGIRVGEVVAAEGSLSLSDVRLAVKVPSSVGSFNWAPDNATIVFTQGDPADIHTAFVNDDQLGSTNLTTSPQSESYPTFSPDGTRIAFSQPTVSRGAVRADIFTMPAGGGAATRVTSKANTPASTNVQATWSPDGAHIAFACSSNSVTAVMHVCRIDAGGKAKAIDLTPKASAYFSVGGWRS